jgi:hypothetical protein
MLLSMHGNMSERSAVTEAHVRCFCLSLQAKNHSSAAALVPLVVTHINKAAEYALMASPDKLDQLRTFTFPFDVNEPLPAANLELLTDAAKVSLCRTMSH